MNRIICKRILQQILVWRQDQSCRAKRKSDLRQQKWASQNRVQATTIYQFNGTLTSNSKSNWTLNSNCWSFNRKCRLWWTWDRNLQITIQTITSFNLQASRVIQVCRLFSHHPLPATNMQWQKKSKSALLRGLLTTYHLRWSQMQEMKVGNQLKQLSQHLFWIHIAYWHSIGKERILPTLAWLCLKNSLTPKLR